MVKQLNIVLFGPPGAGKGTQSENLINKYGLVHLSTGDILRSEIARETELGLKAKEVMSRGELVSDAIVIDMIEAMLDANTNAKGFIFDGFPRTQAQAVALDDLLQKKGTGIAGMLALEVDNEELVKRLLQRGENSGREDDRNEDIIRNRINEYTNKTLPLKNYYNEQGKFHSINGIGTVEEIFKALVDRITFLQAEMDLTALETDIEHLDLTINDFDVANDIAPELLLEIDAIKRAEAEEEEEEKEKQNQVVTPMEKVEAEIISEPKVSAKPKSAKKSKPKAKPVAASKPAKKTAAPKAKAAKKAAKKVSKPAAKKAVTVKKAVKKVVKKVVQKTVAKKAVKKATPKKQVKKAVSKKAVTKKVVAKAKKVIKPLKKVVKKAVKKVAPKKVKKVTSKKTAATKVKVVKKATKKPLKKVVKKVVKKVIAKKKKR